ncbi:TRAP transporter large permease [Luminiphilus sp.]|jgi:tripartite ATP-independent transporter DctM subunit|nr:TRAP transporter large permease [Luminiphilus sp.]MDA9920400.1 TRAP transporter large permease [bacterium]MDA8656124.1 TRAP transporter large permease [Luminiphilus sp.]MDA8754398.1 TRAP transporter large permease [Luminiphilus sp.]MDA9878119.1 TRAP transporter large permease [Luminiphilus sp.]
MELALLIGVLFLLLIMGLPVAFALGIASLMTFYVLDIPLIVGFQRMAASMNIFALMAIPFFVFAGDLMHRAGIAERLIRVADAALGQRRGGLGQVGVGASMMFGAVSGSAIASVSAIGSTLGPMMREKGYDPDYVVNVTATSAVTGLLIPPSHNMIIYAAAAGVSISLADLFLAGILPGLLTGLLLMLSAYLVARKRNYPKGQFPGWRAFAISFAGAIPGLLSAAIVVIGVLSGVFTPTESAGIAVAYTILVALLVYRSLTWEGFFAATTASVRTTAMVMIIIGAAGAFGWLLALLQAPTQLAELLRGITENPILLLLLINLVLLLLGTFMDMAPLIIITTPIFLPMTVALGMDPVHFGIMLLLNLGIGLVTPPVGAVLFVGCAIAKVPIEQTVKTIWPFYGALLLALIAVIYIPGLSLWLPGMLN